MMGRPETKAIRLLLVDNRKDGLKKMATLLQRRYEVVDLCEDFESLKKCFRPGKYDIAIVALEMDRDEGYQCVNYIYAQDPMQRIVTYSAEPEHPSHGAGCAVCLKENRRHRIRKPIMLNELYEEIEQFDERSCSFAETAIEMYEGYISKS